MIAQKRDLICVGKVDFSDVQSDLLKEPAGVGFTAFAGVRADCLVITANNDYIHQVILYWSRIRSST